MEQFTSNLGNADARLVDVPGLHEKPTKEKLLREVLNKAVHDSCLDRSEVLRPFIKNGWPGDELTFGFFKPEDWQGKSLGIPVEFIRLKNFQLAQKTGVVTADIEIGHHLIFWGVRFWYTGMEWHPLMSFSDIRCGEERIQEKQLIRLINRMFLRSDVKEVVTSVANGAIDMESKFIDAVEGCDPEAVPPAIKFS